MNNLVHFSISDSFKLAWEKVSGTKASIWIGIAIISVIVAGFELIAVGLESHYLVISKFFDFVSQIITTLSETSLLYIGIKRAQDLSFSYRDIFRAFQRRIAVHAILLFIIQFIIFTIPILFVFMIIAASGEKNLALMLILAVLAGLIIFYLSIRMIFATAFVVDKQSNAWDAIKLSFKITRENFWNLLLVGILLSLIIVISAIPLGIGLIWSIPFTLIVYGLLYKQLLPNTYA